MKHADDLILKRDTHSLSAVADLEKRRFHDRHSCVKVFLILKKKKKKKERQKGEKKKKKTFRALAWIIGAKKS